LPLYEAGPDLGFRSFGTTRPGVNFGVIVYSDPATAITRSTFGYYIDVENHVEDVVNRRLGNVIVTYDRNVTSVQRRVDKALAALAKSRS
jgi:hypothetical protein